jgi:uncharacterized protein (TIGR00369 family)
VTRGGDDGTDPVDAQAVRSPFAEYMNIEVLERSKGFCRLGYALRDHHRNRTDVLHGGLLLALIDHAGGIADSWTAPGEAARLSITSDLTCHFTRAVKSGRVTATARVISEGRSIYFATTEIHDEAGHLVAFGSSTHKRQRGGGEEAG